MTDIDLILALAENRVPADQMAGAAARLAADPGLAAEVAAQQAAIAAARSAREAALTALERERLRSALMTELNLSPQPAAAPAARRFGGWLTPVATALGIAAVVVGAVVVVPAMIPDAADEIAQTAAPTTVAAEETTTLAAESAGGADELGEAEDDGDAQAFDAGAPPEVPMVESYDLSTLEEDAVAASVEPATERTAFDTAQFEACRDELAAQLPGSSQYVVRAMTEEDGRDLLLMTYVDASGNEGGAAVDPATCDLVATAETADD